MTQPNKENAQSTAQKSLVITIADQSQSKPNKISLRFDSDFEEKAAAELQILSMSKVSLTGTLTAFGSDSWELIADLGVSVVQECVVSLKPVKTRIDTQLRRLYTADYSEPDEDSVMEMEIDEDIEPLKPEIDLYLVILEGIALNLPAYPRADDATLENTAFAAPGVTPMTDEDAKPFASLAALKDKLTKED